MPRANKTLDTKTRPALSRNRDDNTNLEPEINARPPVRSGSALTFDEKMKRLTIILILVICFAAVLVYSKRGKPPSIPNLSETVTISLREPRKGELIVEKTISDQKIIQNMAEQFSRARSCEDHKCASIGAITFISGTEEKTLNILPGHDSDKYEFRFDGGIYRLSRDSYVNALVAAGIERDDILLDGHPSIEQNAAEQPATRLESKPK